MEWCSDIKTRRENMVQNSAKEAMDKVAESNISKGVVKSSKTLGNVEGESLAREIREVRIDKIECTTRGRIMLRAYQAPRMIPASLSFAPIQNTRQFLPTSATPFATRFARRRS